MSLFTIIAKVIGLIPSAVDAGKAIARALRPTPTIDPNNSLLWHTVTYGNANEERAARGLPWRYCTVCQQRVSRQNELCSEAVRRVLLN